MRRLRGQPRAVYRVYGEDEYLAGVDPFADLESPPAEPASHLAKWGAPTPPAAAVTTREHRLRRLAGAAALTGAVGTVGGTIGLVGLRSHPVDRQIAANISPPARIAPTDAGRNAGVGAGIARVASSTNGVHRDAARRDGGRKEGVRLSGARREVAYRVLPSERSPRAVARRSRLISRPEVSVRRVSPSAHVSEPESSAPESSPARYTPSPVANAPQDTPATPLASTSQNAAADAEARPLAQSEFGFER